MRNLGNRIDIRNIAVGIAQRFQIHALGVFLNRRFDFGMIARIDERGLHAAFLEGVRKEVVRAAIDRRLRHDVIALLAQRLQRIRDCRRAAGRGQRRSAAFQRRDALFKHILRGIVHAAVDVALLGKIKQRGRMRSAVKDIARRLINRHSARAGCGIGLFLTNMKLHGFKTVRHLISLTVSYSGFSHMKTLGLPP